MGSGKSTRVRRMVICRRCLPETLSEVRVAGEGANEHSYASNFIVKGSAPDSTNKERVNAFCSLD